MSDLHNEGDIDIFQKNVGDIWSSRYENKKSDHARLHWRQSEKIINHITKLICGEPKNTIPESIMCLINKISPRLPYKNAISVGCGVGHKEMDLIEHNIIEHIDLFELSEKAVDLGKIEAKKEVLQIKSLFM